MRAATVPRADAKMIAELCSDLAEIALRWKERALKAEAMLSQRKAEPDAKGGEA